MRKIVVLITLASTFYLQLNISVFAEELVFATAKFPPWSIWRDDGSVIGIDADVVQELAQRMNLSVTVVRCPWKRCLTLMEQGQADVTGSALRRAEREKYMHYIEPAYLSPSYCVFFVRYGQKQLIQRYEDLYKGLRVGMSRGANYFPRFDNDKNIEREVVTHNSQLFPMLAMGRIDAIVIEEFVGEYFVAQGRFQGQLEKADYRYESGREGFFTLSKKSKLAGRKNEFDQHMKDIIDSGRMQAISAKYTR